ncbi:MAG: NAD-dependent succinate-semialdehyde dehydrogenase [Leucobacter sp.]
MARLDLSRVEQGLLIDGRWETLPDLPRIPVVNPATEEVIAEVPDAGSEEGLRAVAAANAAQESFAALSIGERAGILIRAHELLLESKHEIAAIMTAEMGKPFAEALGEVDYSASYLLWYAHEGQRVQGSQAQSPSGRGQIVLSREPVGVSLLITPWNFPLAMGARKIAPAVVTGCAAVVKPSENTPLTMLFLADIFREAGLPAGALNVIVTLDSPGVIAPILENGLVKHVSFTGSTRVGSILHSQCSRHMIRTSLELGGNAPFIVFDDVDLDRAVVEVTAAKMRNMGEACTAANRILVQETIAAEFAERLSKRFASFTVGDGAAEGTEIGPMIDHASCARIQGLVDDAVSKGARTLTGGVLPEGTGSYYPPTVLADVPRGSRLMHEEIFGPVAPIIAFTDEADALAVANDTEYGLASYLMTNDLARALRVSRGIEAGMVGLNAGSISDAAAPLGGIGASGIGREGGILGIDEFLEYKYTFIPND